MNKQLLRNLTLTIAMCCGFALSVVAEEAQLLTLGFYKADNAALSKDYVATVPAFSAGTNSYNIQIALPGGLSLDALIPVFTVNEGNTVSVDGETVTSGSSSFDFNDPIDFMVSNSSKTSNLRYTITVVEGAASQWKELSALDAVTLSGIEGFSGVYSGAMMKVNPVTGEPYMVYGARGVDNKLSVAKFADGAWSLVGAAAFSPIVNGSNYSIDLALDGTPYVAFGDKDASQGLSVMKYDGSAWSLVGKAGNFESQAKYPYVVALEKNLVVNLINGGKSGVGGKNIMGVSIWDGQTWSGSTHSQLPTDQQTFYAYASGNGKTAVVISLNRATVDGVKMGHNIFKYENGKWETLLSNYNEPNATQTSISPGSLGTTVAADGTIYAWAGDDAALNGTFDVRLKKYDPTAKAWNTVGGNALPLGYEGGIESHLSLDVAVDKEGTPYVAFNNARDDNKLYVMYLDPKTKQWSALQQLADKATEVNIEFAPNGVGFISYLSGNDGLIHLLQLADETSSVKTVQASGAVRTEYFLISGERVDVPAKGLYIQRTTDANGSVSVKKIVK
jgi:hypothetical protein